VLSEEERERIRAEEIFREEVRRQLVAKTPPKRGFWKSGWQLMCQFMNSSFGIWLLSTVVVGAVTFEYTKNLEQSKAAESARDTVQRLNVELSRRAAELRYEVQSIDAASPTDRDSRFREAVETVRHPRNPIFEAFARRPLSSVLWERTRFEVAASTPCQVAFGDATRLEERAQTIIGPIDLPGGLTLAKKLRAELEMCAK
jgi:hypothetical protein